MYCDRKEMYLGRNNIMAGAEASVCSYCNYNQEAEAQEKWAKL